MDHPSIEKEQLVSRYLAGTLNETQRELFEDHALTCSQCLSELEADERFGIALRALESQDELTTHVENRQFLPKIAATGSKGRVTWAIATAAIWLMALLPFWLVWRDKGRLETLLTQERQNLREVSTRADLLQSTLDAERQTNTEQKAQTAAAQAVPVLRLDVLRSTADQPNRVLVLEEGQTLILILFELGLEPGDYQLDLVDPTSRVLFHGELEADVFGALNLALPAADLPEGVYRAEIRSAETRFPARAAFRLERRKTEK